MVAIIMMPQQDKQCLALLIKNNVNFIGI